MLAEAVFEVCCYAGVVFVVLLDYVKVPHIILVGLPSSRSSSRQAHKVRAYRGRFRGGHKPP